METFDVQKLAESMAWERGIACRCGMACPVPGEIGVGRYLFPHGQPAAGSGRPIIEFKNIQGVSKIMLLDTNDSEEGFLETINDLLGQLSEPAQAYTVNADDKAIKDMRDALKSMTGPTQWFPPIPGPSCHVITPKLGDVIVMTVDTSDLGQMQSAYRVAKDLNDAGNRHRSPRHQRPDPC